MQKENKDHDKESYNFFRKNGDVDEKNIELQIEGGTRESNNEIKKRTFIMVKKQFSKENNRKEKREISLFNTCSSIWNRIYAYK